MIIHYLLFALRQINRHRGHTFINVMGLAVGLVCIILIGLYVIDEFQFDRFHTKSDRIYRVVSGNLARVPPALGPALREAFPEIQDHVSLLPPNAGWMMRYDDRVFYESLVYWSNASLFKVFDFPLIKGNPVTALAEPYSTVISESMAAKYFGEEDPIGKVINADDGWGFFRVTGVMRDLPANSHIQADFFLSLITLVRMEREQLEREALRWIRVGYHYIYVLLPDDYPVTDLAEKLPAFIRNPTYVNPEVFTELDLAPRLQPITDIHLYSNLESEISPNSDVTYVYGLIVVGLFTLIIACVNFVNLVTAHSATRMREIGIRKVVGANRIQLIRQIIGESLLTALAALLIALIICYAATPVFYNLSGKDIGAVWLQWPLEISFILIILVIAIGLLSGFYPALSLSAFTPQETLKGGSKPGGRGGGLRKILVITQFSLSVLLIISAYVVYDQLTYMRSKSLGFDKDHVFVIKAIGNIQEKYDAFKQTLLQDASIIEVGGSEFLPGLQGSGGDLETITVQRPGQEKQYIQCFDTGFDLVDALGLEVLAGRWLSLDYALDRNFEALVLNETAVRRLGWSSPEVAINQPVISDEWLGTAYVVGVVRDFHIKSLHQTVEPLAMTPSGGGFIAIRIHPERIDEAINHVEKTWAEVFPGYPLNYTFMEDTWDRLYLVEERLGQVLAFFSFLTIGLACLGLLGLVTFMFNRRTKELGIRKVLGASIGQLGQLLSGELLMLIVIANVIAWPIAYLSMKQWLQSFAYRVDISMSTFILVTLTSLIITLLTIGYHVIKASRGNPVDALRYE